MKLGDVVDYFGSKKKLSEALGISGPAISRWGDEIPLARQYQIEVITNGKLKASPNNAGNEGDNGNPSSHSLNVTTPA